MTPDKQDGVATEWEQLRFPQCGVNETPTTLRPERDIKIISLMVTSKNCLWKGTFMIIITKYLT